MAIGKIGKLFVNFQLIDTGFACILVTLDGKVSHPVVDICRSMNWAQFQFNPTVCSFISCSFGIVIVFAASIWMQSALYEIIALVVELHLFNM